MAVIDFHSHILPGIDDGSKSIEMSIEMLHMAKEQRVDIMVATPHFYASRHRVEDFLRKRNHAYEHLKDKLPEGVPELKLGAEVAYFSGISKADRLDDLTVEGTNLILLELPFVAWTDTVIHEVRDLIKIRKFHFNK